MNNLAIFCADVGSIKKNRFGWAATLPDGHKPSGVSIEDFAANIANQVELGSKVAVGFECPLFVPVRGNPIDVNSARQGEGNRSWSASAGAAALGTGLVEVLWVMNKVTSLLGESPSAVFDWSKFLDSKSIFLWEAFVSSAAKGVGHVEDARIAVSQLEASLPDPMSMNAIDEESVLSLVGAAALRAGWSDDIAVLSEPCLVIKA